MMSLLVLLVIAACCGAIGAKLGGSGRIGCLATTAVGFIGALLGSWASRKTGIPDPFNLVLGGHVFPIVWSIAGGALFTAVLTLLTRKRAP